MQTTITNLPTEKTNSNLLHRRTPAKKTSDLSWKLAQIVVLIVFASVVWAEESTVQIVSGTVAGQTLTSSLAQIGVACGASITGTVRVRVSNTFPGASITPLCATPTWGIPQSDYWGINSWVPTGISDQDATVNLTAPTVPGAYYIVFAMEGSYNYAQIMSGTHPGWSADWIYGVNVARLSASDLELARVQGCIPKWHWYGDGRYGLYGIAMAAVKVFVGGATSESTIQIVSGTLAGQTLTSSLAQIGVACGASITGTVRVRVSNTYPGAAITPLCATPTWGIPQSDYWGINSWVPTGISDQDATVNITAPTVPGTYYIVFAMEGSYNYAQIMSGTHPAWDANWSNGLNVAQLSASDLELARAQGCIPKWHWYGDGRYGLYGIAMAAVKVFVGGATSESTIQIVSGTVASQTLTSSLAQIGVACGASITGTVRVRVSNTYPGAAITPLCATPTWGIAQSDHWGINSCPSSTPHFRKSLRASDIGDACHVRGTTNVLLRSREHSQRT